MTGKVKNFWPDKHFGFIKEGSSREIFFHEDAVASGTPVPQAGQVVAYEVGDYNGRRCATNVRVQSALELLSGEGGAR